MVALVAVLALTSGCAAFSDDAPAPDDTATALVRGLQGLTLEGVPLVDEASRAALDELAAPLAPFPHRVELAETERDRSSAEVTLAWTWDLAGKSWSYETTVDLVLDEVDGWRVDWQPSGLEPSLARGEALEVERVAGERGEILGRDGKAIVTERPVLRYGLDKAMVDDERQHLRSARRIAHALDIDVDAFVDKVRAYGDRAFVEGIALRVEDARDAVDPSFGDIPGARMVPDTMMLAPTREFAAEILGRVGPVTAELLEKSGGTLHAGDEVGLSGLQADYEATLAGRDGVRVTAIGPSGEERDLFRVRHRDGADLRLTLDRDLQLRAEEVLSSHVSEDGPRSALVALRPSTGEVLAAANGPGNGGLNVATTGRYAPGSTFKVVTALALLRAGVDPDDTLPCPATTYVDGRRFKNYDNYPASMTGDIDFTTAIAHSCNTALIDARGELDGTRLAEAAAALGLGVDHDLGAPAYFGQVPEPRTETEHAASLIGQGRVLASPLAMAAVAASVQAGEVVVPHVLADDPVDRPAPDVPLTPEEAAALRQMMRAVVTHGSGAFLADLAGEVGAKTGTAEYGAADGGGELATHAWMIATRGDLAVAVFVETGASGSHTAGPILEDFLR